MTKHRRRILFWTLTSLFLLSGIPLIFYSFGYRLDRESVKWRIVRAGGLSLAPTPTTGVRIFVDNTLERETNIFSRELFLQGLTPRKYRVRLEKDGYHTWEKTLRVYPAQVVRAEALLVSTEKPQKLTHGEYISIQFLNDDEQALILTKPRRAFDLFSLDTQTTTKLPPANAVSTATTTYTKTARDFVASKKIKTFAYEPSRIVWWDDHSIWIKWLDGEAYLPTYADRDESKLITLAETIRNIAFYPNREALVVATDTTVDIIELDGRDRHNIFTIFRGKKPHILVSPENELLFILSEGTLFSIPLL
ncbi:MAG: hypothetical protein AAB417_02580 [Patescibacteria group bacterium]